MSECKLNGVFLSSLGIHVENTIGLETIPKKKGITFHDWPDEDGVEPISTPYASRDITLKCVMQAKYETGIGYFSTLQGILNTQMSVDISFYPKIIYCDCVKEIKPTRLNSINDDVNWRFDLVLREFNPSNQTQK